jgi:hypothetical protein
MKLRLVAIFISGMFLFNIFGCASIPEEHQGAATGAGIGAATGALGGALIGGNVRSVAIGVLAGALVGGVIGHYAVDQKRTAQETNNKYSYQSSDVSVRIENASASPTSAKAGDKVEMSATYALLGVSSGETVEVIEKREITHQGELVGNPEVKVQKSGGTYESVVPLFLPDDARPGLYKVKTTISAANSSDTRESSFHVR